MKEIIDFPCVVFVLFCNHTDSSEWDIQALHPVNSVDNFRKGSPSVACYPAAIMKVCRSIQAHSDREVIISQKSEQAILHVITICLEDVLDANSAVFLVGEGSLIEIDTLQ